MFWHSDSFVVPMSSHLIYQTQNCHGEAIGSNHFRKRFFAAGSFATACGRLLGVLLGVSSGLGTAAFGTALAFAFEGGARLALGGLGAILLTGV